MFNAVADINSLKVLHKGRITYTEKLKNEQAASTINGVHKGYQLAMYLSLNPSPYYRQPEDIFTFVFLRGISFLLEDRSR